MSYTVAQFEKAVSVINSLPKDGPVKPSVEDQLVFYGLYKQATAGDNTKPKPGLLDFTGKAKWEAYEKVKGLSQEEAKSKYVAYFLEVLEKSGTGAEYREQILAA